MRSLIRFIYRIRAAWSVLLLDQHLIPLVIIDSTHNSAPSYGKATASALAALYYRISVWQHHRILPCILADDTHLVRLQLSHARERTRIPIQSCIMSIIYLPFGHSIALRRLLLLLLLVLHFLGPSLSRRPLAALWNVT